MAEGALWTVVCLGEGVHDVLVADQIDTLELGLDLSGRSDP